MNAASKAKVANDTYYPRARHLMYNSVYNGGRVQKEKRSLSCLPSTFKENLDSDAEHNWIFLFKVGAKRGR